MFCLERRISRELFWSGFGFQVWCQLLTHISRAWDASLLIVDEPEIYLHPDIQRQLLGILREIGPDILLATHSTEIMSEADPSEIILIDKSRQSAERLRDVEDVQMALGKIGSIQNITLTRLARNRKVLFIEGSDDFVILRRFARQLGLTELASGVDITAVESEGFSSWDRVRSTGWYIEKALGVKIRMGAVYDRDFHCSEEIDDVINRLEEHLAFAHVHARKEIENYLLVPSVLERAVLAVAEDRRRRGSEVPKIENVADILAKLTEPIRSVVQGQYIARRTEYLRSTGLDAATVTSTTLDWFDKKWRNLESRMEIVPGKQVLALFRQYIQEKYSLSLTDYRIISSFSANEIPADLSQLLRELEDYRKSAAA